MPAATPEALDEFILACRYGEDDGVRGFADAYGWDAAVGARDDRGNSGLHMACGNGHLGVVKMLLPHTSASLLQQTNDAGSPPLHWAVMNNHVEVVMELANLPEERGGGLKLVKQKNAAGRDALAEATFAGEGKEQVAGWLEGFVWKAEGGRDEPEGAIGAETTSNEDVAAEDDTEDTEDANVDSLTAKTDDLDVNRA